MKRNFDVVLKKFDGKELVRRENPEPSAPEVPLTLKHVAIEAIFAQLPGEESMSGQTKLDLHLLGVRVNAGGDVELKAEELALIKERVGRAWPAIIAGPALIALDPAGAK